MRISIHALREEGDSTPARRRSWLIYFYPRPPRGGRHLYRFRVVAVHDFYPRPPRGGRLEPDEEGGEQEYFYPRPPRGGRPRGRHRSPRGRTISIHALREEGDLLSMGIVPGMCLFLSTPSARRATSAATSFSSLATFLSTPSARRATAEVCGADRRICISIHALREEGDIASTAGSLTTSDFYPRPPRGGRRSTTRHQSPGC